MQAQRKGYVYRFIDTMNQTLYVGKTVNMNHRMKNHFSKKSHLYKSGMYEQIQRIEYMTCKNEFQSLQYELYFINLYKPKYNTQSKIRSSIERDPSINDNWRVWKVVKEIPLEQNTRVVKWVPVVMVIFFISLIIISIKK